MKLVVDQALGKLATWLRVLGLDTVYLRPGTGLREKELLLSTRLLLTKNRRSEKAALIILANDPWEQLKETLVGLGLEPDLRQDRLRLFSRCLSCNAQLRSISRRRAAGLVPEYVLITQTDFKSCQDCGRVFWPGTHQDRMRERLMRLKREIA